MKSIKLTEKHKSKLLKMCKKLFSEYVEIDFDESGLLTLWKEKCPSTQWTEIHWFEFCMTHLAEKVFIQDESLNDYLLTFNVSKHPIDYLYEEFKKLK